ncbi:hypothetical protein [Limimaricola pyoseonensis]|uniref:Uncharacterized protein n=1 Tax=Limimaricola pyoseonensis TaxID=521013 RepID=A0A1G7FVR1_9RHOB|nr:hypothetical protein [Limimaricola pyoseonensis]SDE80013.1 hypothetical protein SAMN04488567_2592 [Limimaricola pyoseonensis]
MERITVRSRPVLPVLWRAAAWGAAVATAAAAAALGQWLLALGAAGAVVLALLPRGYTRISGIEMPAGLGSGILVFCLCAFVLGEAGGLYRTSAWWDMALHLTASAVLALVGVALALLPTAGAPPRTPLWILGTLGVGFAALVGAGWELFEFGIDALFGTNAQRSGLPDTMGDMAVNLAGATYGALAAQRRLGFGARWPLSGLLAEFCARNEVIYGGWTGRPFTPRRPGPEREGTR